MRSDCWDPRAPSEAGVQDFSRSIRLANTQGRGYASCALARPRAEAERAPRGDRIMRQSIRGRLPCEHRGSSGRGGRGATGFSNLQAAVAWAFGLPLFP